MSLNDEGLRPPSPPMTRPATLRSASLRGAAAAVLVSGLALASCKDEKPSPDPTPKGRSEVIAATGPTATVTAPVTHAPKPPSAPRRLCDTVPAAVGRGLPGVKLDHLEAPGAAPVGDRIPSGGKWTWINLWAAWCNPCKEEIPRLRGFEAKLAQGGTPINLVFLSLDDDERQARRFLESQPATGLRASFWLTEGKMRTSWLSDVKMKADPQLPQQILVDPGGAIRCVIDGAVEDSDYPALAAIFARR